MASTSAARRAWNDAMKATAGSAALPPALQKRPQKRRSDRHKKQERRAKAARKVTNATMAGVSGGDADDEEAYRAAVWMDALEGVDPLAAATAEDDEEYDELDDLTTTAAGKKGGPRGGKKRKRKKGPGAAATPKRFLPRALASILVEEAGRDDGVARQFLHAEARLPPGSAVPPPRKFCPVTGLPANYTEPRTGIPYSNLRALEQIRERPPPWMTLGGTAAYFEAAKSIQDE